MPDSGIPRKIMLSIVEISGRALSMIMSEVVREDYAQYSALNPGFLECARSFKKSDKTNAHSAVEDCFERSDQPKFNL